MEIGALNYRLSLETTSFFSGLRAVYNKINALANTRTDIGVNVHANTAAAMQELQEVYNAGIDVLKVLNTSPNMRFSTNFKEVANDFMKLGTDIETALYKALSAQEFEINDDAIETYRKKFAVVNDQIVNMNTGEILDFPVDFDTNALVQYLNDLETVPEEMDAVVQKATQLKDLLSKPIDVGQQLTLFDITNPEQDIATATNTLMENASEIPEKFERAVADLKFPELQPNIETQQISSDVSYINSQLDEIPDIVEISADMDFGQSSNLHSMYDNTRTDSENIDTSDMDLSDASKIKTETTKVALDITDALAKIAQVEVALRNLQNAANITLELNDSGVDRVLSAAAENVSEFVNSTGTRYIDAYVDLNGTAEAKDKLKEFKDAYEDVVKIKSINLKVSIRAAKNRLEELRKDLLEITTQDYDPIQVAVMLYDADTLANDLGSIIQSYQEFADNQPVAIPIELKDTELYAGQIKNLVTDIQTDIQNKPLVVKIAENTGLPTYAELVAMLGRLQSWYDANPLKVNFSSEVDGESVQELKDLLNNIQAWYDANPLHFVFGSDEGYSGKTFTNLVSIFQAQLDRHPLHFVFGSDEGYSNKTFPNLVAVFQKQLDRNPLHFVFDTTSAGLPTYAELVAMLGRLQSWYDANPLKVNFSSEVDGESVQELKDLLNNIQAWYDANPLRMAFDDAGLDSEYSKLHQIIMDLQPYYDANPLDIRIQIDDTDIVNKVAAINEMLGIAETSDTSITIRANMDDTDIVNKVAAINEMLASLETVSGSIKIVTNLEEFAKSLEKVENDIKELSQKKGTVSILGDIGELKKTIAQVKNLLTGVNRLKGTTKIFSDATAATKTFTSIKARIKEIDDLAANIDIFSNIDDVETKVNKVKEYVNEINALSGNVKIETDIFEAIVNFEQVKKDIAQIKADVDKLNAFNGAIKISIETDADISAARSELEKIGAAVDLMEEYDATVTVRADVSAAKQSIEELGISLSNLKRDVVSTPITIPVSFEPTWNREEWRKPDYTEGFDLSKHPAKANSNVIFNATLNTDAFDRELDTLYQELDLLRQRARERILFNVDDRGVSIAYHWLEFLREEFESTQKFLDRNKLQIRAEATIDKDIKNIWTDTEVRQMRENLEALDNRTYTITIDSNIKEYAAAASRLNTYLGKIPTQIRTSWFLERAYDQTEINNINKQLDELTADVVIPVKIGLSGTDEIKGTADAALQVLPSGKEISAIFNIDTSAVDEAQAKLDKLVDTLNETNTNKTVSVTLDTSNLKLENVTVDGSDLKITGVKISQVDVVDTSAIQSELDKLRGGVEIPITADITQAMSSVESVMMSLTKLSSGIEIPIFTAADFGNLKAGFESLKTDFKSLNTSCQNLNAKINKLGEDSTIQITADTSEIDSAIGEIASALVILKENSSLKFSTKDVGSAGKQAVESVGDRAQKKTKEVVEYISEKIDTLSVQGYEMVESWGNAFAGASWLYVLNKVSDVIGDIVSDSNSFIMDMERSTISFTYLLQDYTKAQAMIRELQDFAIKSPLNFSGATRGVQQLMVMGFSAMDSLEMLETITDAAAVSGRDMNDSIQRIALALGQIKQTGILRAQEANQLIDVNIPVYELLQEQLDISLTSSDLGKAKIESEKAIDAILTGLKEKYGGASEAMQMTIEGAISAITDAFSILYQQLSSPVVAHVRGLLQDINEAIQGITESLQNLSFEDFMKKIFPESVVENATEIIYNFQMSFVVLRKYLEGFVKWMSNSFNAFSGVISTLSNAFNNFFVAVYAAFSKWYQFSETFRNISHVLGFATVLAAAAAAAKLFLKVLSPLTSVLFLIPKIIASVITALLSMNLAMAASNIAIVALLALLGYLIYRAGLFKNIWNSLTGIFDQGKISADDYSDAIKDLGEQLNDANKDVSDLAETVDDNFNQSFDEVFLIDPSDASSIDAIAGTLGTLGDVLTGVNNISGLKIDLTEAFNIDTLKDTWDAVIDELKKYIGDFSYDDVARAISAAFGTLALTGNPFLALITGLVGMFWEELAEQLGIDPENGDKIIGAAIGLGVTKVIGKLANWQWGDYIKWGPGIAGISAGVFPAITEALDQLDKKGYVYDWGAVIGEVDFSLVFSGVSWMVNGQKVTDAGAVFDKLAEELGGLDKDGLISTDLINTTVGKQLKALGIDEVSKGVYQLASAVSVAADLVFAWQLGNVLNELVELDIAGALWEALPLATGYAIAYAGGAPALAVPIAAVMTLSFMGVEAAWNAGGTMLDAINEATEALNKGASGSQRDIANAIYGTDWTALLINGLESVNTYSNLKASLSGIEKQYEAATGNSFDEFFENIVGVDKDTYGTLLMKFKRWQETGSNTYKKAVSSGLSGLTSAGLDIFALSVSNGNYDSTDLAEKQKQNAETYRSLTSILKENTGYYQSFNQLIPIQQTELQSVIDSLNNTQTLSADQILLLTRFTDENWQTLQENLKTDEAVEALQKITNSLGQYGTAYKAAISEIQSTSETLDSAEASEALNQYRTKVGGVYKALGDEEAITELNSYIESLTLPEIDWDKIYNYFEAVGAPQELLDAIILVRDNYDKFGDAAEDAKKAAVEQTERAAEIAGDLAPDIQEQIDKVKNFLSEIDWTAWENYLKSIGMDEEQIRALIDPMKSAAETLQNGLTEVENTASKHISDAATSILDNTEQRCQEWANKLGTLKDKIQTNTGEILKKFSSLLSSENKDFNFLNLGDFQLNLQLSKASGSNTKLNTLRVQSAYATGGIIDREQVALVGEGNKREAVIPLENQSAMAPFAEAVASGVSSVLGPMISSISSGSTTSQQLQPVYVGTLIADDRGLRELQRKMSVIQLKESRRG